ncbi:MAG: DUF3783 domain-containing protein [Lachnospiraceae bacterium]|nr:DUF3783 domain-containing protein [Lachnospiraceae bacterium]
MIKRNKVRETVLYFTPEPAAHVMKLKGVLVQMGIRIRNVAPEQAGETIGSLLGLEGYDSDPASEQTTEIMGLTEITEEMLVMHQFSGSRMDELLLNLRRAGVPKINLKAIVTDSNIGWTFHHLYEEIKEEHEKMRETNQ